MHRSADHPRLIVNADDYGYFLCVSKGILRAAAEGVVTATGVFANMPHFEEQAAWLGDCGSLDVGVHLNLTDGMPLTSDLQKTLASRSGRFARKFAMARAILAGTIGIDAVRNEWRAQIERCLEHGLKLRFLNSHEHMHMLPSLFAVANALASDYDIGHVRFPTSRIAGTSSPQSLLRGAIIAILGAVNRHHGDSTTVSFLGMEASGRLGMRYLERSVPQLRAGQVYELMCHPGDFDPQEVRDPRLLDYHDWRGELRTLTSPALRALLDRCGVELIGYRHLLADSEQVTVHQG